MNNLEAKVAAVNRVNSHALACYSRVAEVLQNYIGKKVLLASGQLASNLKKDLDALQLSEGFPESGGWPSGAVSVVVGSSHGYTLKLDLKTCYEVDGRGCVYADAVVYVGDIEHHQILKAIMPPPEAKYFRTDYTADEVVRLRKAYQDAKDAEARARSAVEPFGMY